MKKTKRILAIVLMTIVIGCSCYSFVTLKQLMLHLDEIEKIARMGNHPSYQIVNFENQ